MKKSLFAICIAIITLIFVPFYTNFSLINAVPFGNYIIFNGGTVKSQIQTPVIPSQFEMEVWIRPYSITGVRNILSISDSFNQTNYQVGVNGGSVTFSYRFGTNSQRSIVTGSILENVWQKLRVSVDSSSTKIFLNDSQISSQNGATPLKPIGQNIILGINFSGEMDNFKIIKDGVNYIVWNFDEARGQSTSVDSSGNGLHGTLLGGDNKIHFFGVMPSPTRFVLPTLPSLRRITPPVFPTSQPLPTGVSASPTPTVSVGGIRSDRPVFSR